MTITINRKLLLAATLPLFLAACGGGESAKPADEHGDVGVHGPHRRVGGEAAFGGGIPLVHLVGCAGEHFANAATKTVADGFERGAGGARHDRRLRDCAPLC